MKPSELRTLAAGDLHLKLKELSDELVTIRLKSRTSGVDKPHRVRQLRRDIARVHTVLKESDRGHESSSSPSA